AVRGLHDERVPLSRRRRRQAGEGGPEIVLPQLAAHGLELGAARILDRGRQGRGIRVGPGGRKIRAHLGVGEGRVDFDRGHATAPVSGGGGSGYRTGWTTTERNGAFPRRRKGPGPPEGVRALRGPGQGFARSARPLTRRP